MASRTKDGMPCVVTNATVTDLPVCADIPFVSTVPLLSLSDIDGVDMAEL